MPQSHESLLAFAIGIMIVVFSTQDTAFISARNIMDVLSTYSVIGILAAGLLVVLISGELDISFSATMTAAQYAAALWVIEHGGNWVIMFSVAIMIGTTLGLINALIVHYLKASSVVVSIAMLNIYFGATIVLSKGEWLYAFPDWFFGGVSLPIWQPADGKPISINLAIFTLVGFWLITYIILAKTKLGKSIYAAGGNKDAAVRAGFSILKIRLFSFGFLGLAAGIAAVVHAQLVQTVAPNALIGMELEVLAAVVLGGASLVGGIGTIRGMIMGVTFVALMKNGLTIIGVSTYSHKFLLGLVIVIAVIVTSNGHKNLVNLMKSRKAQ